MKVMDEGYVGSMSGKPREKCAVASSGKRYWKENGVGRLGMFEGGILDPGSVERPQLLSALGGMGNEKL